MSKISLAPDASGTGIFTIASPNSDTNRTLTLPDDTGTIVTNSGNQAGSFTTLNTSGQVVFNDAGADVDFRVEGDTNANLFVVDASADAVGIGTSTPGCELHVNDSVNDNVFLLLTQATTGSTFGSDGLLIGIDANEDAIFANYENTNMIFRTNATERMRIDSSGKAFVNCTSVPYSGTNAYLNVNSNSGSGLYTITSIVNLTASQGHINFVNNNGDVGSINTNGSSTAYNTSSDYRLKENVAPMTGALAKVLELNPVTYTWKADGSAGEGFIAHELQAVCPDAVTGEKDATEIRQVKVSPAVPATYDEEGNELTPAVEAVYEEREVPVYQGVDTSFLVATLTAAIQELSAKNDALEARIAALETGA